MADLFDCLDTQQEAVVGSDLLPGSVLSEPRRSPEALAGWPKDFRESFWAAYPRKVGKKAAMAELERIAKRKEVEFPRLMAALHRYSDKVKDPQYVCHPITWLRQGRWDDVLDSQKTCSGSNQPQSTKVYLREETPQFMAWVKYLKSQGKSIPCTRSGEWGFDAEWPPGKEKPPSGET